MMNKLSIYVSVLLLLSIFVYANPANLQNDDYNFLSLKEIGNKTYVGVGWEKGWWYYNARSYNTVTELDFSKNFWMPIAPWEYEVCSRGLSTQLVYEEGAGVGSMWSGIYADAVTVEAYRRTPLRNNDVGNSLLYEVSWYFHPSDKGKYYSLKLTNSATGVSKVIQERVGASTKSGGSGYSAFYSAEKYDKAVLSDESTPREYTFYIVNETDASR